jgi:hypothetical protein
MDKARLLPDNDSKVFEALVRAGLVAKEKRNRGFWYELTDKGWNVAGRNLGAPLPQTKKASPVLQAWLARLQGFLEARGLALADVFTAGAGVQPGRQSPSEPATPADLRERIRAAYFAVTDGRLNTAVRIADIRARLVDVDRAVLDDTLAHMHVEEGTTLSGLNNPQEITAADQAAVLDFKGEPMYVLWITR